MPGTRVRGKILRARNDTFTDPAMFGRDILFFSVPRIKEITHGKKKKAKQTRYSPT
jgi:hypothetical protein